MSRTDNIYLIGFSGCGKSTIGPALAKARSARFYDTDALVEERAGKAIRRIFEEDGEPAFRALEREVILEMTGLEPDKVVALGGGAFEDALVRDRVGEDGIRVFLNCNPEVLVKRLIDKSDRPLVSKYSEFSGSGDVLLRNRIDQLLGVRMGNYRSADIEISISNQPVEEVVRLITEKLEEFDAES